MPWIYISEEDKERLDNINLDQDEIDQYRLYPVLQKLIPFYNAYNDPQVETDGWTSSDIREKIWFIQDGPYPATPRMAMVKYAYPDGKLRVSLFHPENLTDDLRNGWLSDTFEYREFFSQVVGSVSFDVITDLTDHVEWAENY